MKIRYCIFLWFTGLALAACISGPGEEDPIQLGEEPIQLGDDPIQLGEDPAENLAEEAAEDQPEGEAIVFEEDESMQIYSDSLPPVGGWTLTHMAGTVLCLGQLALDIPALPPEWAEVALSEDGITMTLTTASGTVILTQVEVNTEGEERSSSYQSIIIVAGNELTYNVVYNAFGDGVLQGSIFHDPSDGCTQGRPFEAVFIGP